MKTTLSKKDLKIARLIDRGVFDPKVIAKKLGYSGNSLTADIQRVQEGIARLKEANKVIHILAVIHNHLQKIK